MFLIIFFIHVFLVTAEAVTWRCSVKKVLLNFRNIFRKTPVSKFFDKVEGVWPVALLILRNL